MAKIKTSLAANKERAYAVYDRLDKAYPAVRCTLEYKNPLQLLIMTILAAQCTDERVNIVCKELFKKAKTAQDFVNMDIKALEAAVHSCGFYRQKAKSIKHTCAELLEKYNGEVPGTMEELTQLRGVGRKTANVLLGECFGKQGVVVDTHCGRVARRLGFTRNTDAVKIEQDLMKVWPPDRWFLFSHFMVFHGRAVCNSRAPKCSTCFLSDLCPFPDTQEGKKIAR